MAYDVKAVKRKWEGLASRCVGPTSWGETITVRGRVRKTIPPDRVELELSIENAGEVTVPATATVILPVS